MAGDFVIALDVDGVLVEVGYDNHWLDIIGAEFGGLTEADLEPFFRDHWGPVVVGECAVQDALAAFAPDLDADRFLQRWCEESTRMNHEMIDAAKQWQANGARVVFIDDAFANVESARAHGWHAIHYPHDTDWREQVDRYFR